MQKILFLLFLIALSHVISQAQTSANLDFNLKNVDGRDISLSTFNKEKGLIVIFVSNSCPVSEIYQARIVALHNKYSKAGYPVVTIDPADSFQKMKDRATAKKYPYYFLHDADQQITKNYQVNTNTHTFVLKNTAEGFKLMFDGAIDDDLGGDYTQVKYVENAITQILENKPVALKKTKVIGCPFTFRSAKGKKASK